jgi:rhodanese-related sulfurtransferase
MSDRTKHYLDKLTFETDSWDLYESISRGERMVVIDTRSPEAYALEHIPGAINIPHRTMSPDTTSELDRETLYVTYCDGIGCNASTKGALRMSQLGFKVKELIGGLDWWRRDGYATEGEQSSPGKDLVCGC